MAWRDARILTEHEHYMHLRKLVHAGSIPYLSEDECRARAEEYATESCRLAVAQWNEQH